MVAVCTALIADMVPRLDNVMAVAAATKGDVTPLVIGLRHQRSAASGIWRLSALL